MVEFDHWAERKGEGWKDLRVSPRFLAQSTGKTELVTGIGSQ